MPADSPNLIESKSLKLYLGSFAMSSFAVASDVRMHCARSGCLCGCAGKVTVEPVSDTERGAARLAGTCIDELEVELFRLGGRCRPAAGDIRQCSEDLHTHLLRSLCPVTAQPDIGSLQISYRGPRIDPRGLLRYIVSFREHNDFHEACIERMFVDLIERCGLRRLTVYARYQRRGGIDINPFRSNAGEQPLNLRLWRQ